ncbi:MAG: hydantoinase/oxoprolinase N-terminal domain-containing protein [Chloroflexota bacterium]
MTIALGIDTGGTYTDAVLVEHRDGRVLISNKALTTRHDLSMGIGRAVAAVLAEGHIAPHEIDLVALSTTLATNAIVEGQGSPVCLLLVGYDPDLIHSYGFERDLVTSDVVYLKGGHNEAGDEVEPLDEAAAREAILARRDRVQAFAISGYFGVRNPTHELRLRELVEQLTGLPVTCGHELTTRLNSVRRATTTALNARLIPLLQELIATVRRTLDAQGIAAPLMVVKGDGSLVKAEWAMRRPIETILSGPAASVVGAWHLAWRYDPALHAGPGVWVVDVGGTTTDIAVLHEGRPRLNAEGAQVGGWRTMVEAADVHTAGLGGDSHVRLDDARRLLIGPRRVVPLCLLASEHPQVTLELREQVGTRQQHAWSGQFVLAQRADSMSVEDSDRSLLRQLAAGPRSLVALVRQMRYGALLLRQIERLEAQRLILRAGFTPTDALHALGHFQRWDTEAARLGAELLAAQAGIPVERFCRQVVAGVSQRVTKELLNKVLTDEASAPQWEREPSALALLDRALGAVSDSHLDCQLRLRQPLVAIGAPVAAYLPKTAEQLHTKLVIPPHAEVANAVGAVVGSVVQRLEVILRPLDEDGQYRLHLPDGVRDFDSVEAAVAFAQQVVAERVVALARQAGAHQVELKFKRVDQNVPVRTGWGQELYLGSQLTFTAVGRPGSVVG